MSIKVGIDFGTSNSGVAVYDGRQVQLLPVDPKNVIPEVIKTVLYITREYRASIGQEAVEHYYRDNVNRQRRFVRQWAGEIDVYGSDMHYVRDVFVYVDELQPGRLLQYLKTALRKEGYEGTQIFERYYTVADLARTYLSLLKQRAEHVLGGPIHAATLGRPVKFSESPEQDQKAQETLRQAAYEAGFKEVDFELEPIAAALDYEQSLAKPQNVVIFDFGGGTLDIAVMRLGDPQKRMVYASGGVDIAGSDFDRAIIDRRMLRHFGYGLVKHHPEIMEMINAIPDWMALPYLGTPINKNILEKAIHAGVAPIHMKALQGLIYNDLAFTFYNRVEAGKISLSSDGATIISLEDKDIALWELYTRYQFETDIYHYLVEVEKVLLETIARSGLEPGQIDAVVKTGGSSSIPLFSEMLARIFGRGRVKESNAFTSVVAGLAIKAGESSIISPPMARSTSDEALWRARELIDDQYAQPLDLDELARTANFSRYHFLRAFRRAFHATPHEYLTRKRVERARELLAESELTVTEICFEVGFESLGSFSTLFHKLVGWSPSIYRARAWEMRRNPLKFIPHCYVIMHGIPVSGPKE